MSTPTPDDLAARRAAIEEALRQRLDPEQRATTSDATAAGARFCVLCQATSAADARFCTHCGTRFEDDSRHRPAPEETAPTHGRAGAIALLCVTCEATTAADAHFCTHCGTKFNARVVPAGASARGSGS